MMYVKRSEVASLGKTCLPHIQPFCRCCWC